MLLLELFKVHSKVYQLLGRYWVRENHLTKVTYLSTYVVHVYMYSFLRIVLTTVMAILKCNQEKEHLHVGGFILMQ